MSFNYRLCIIINLVDTECFPFGFVFLGGGFADGLGRSLSVIVYVNHNGVSQIYIKDKQSVECLRSYSGINGLM